MYFGSWKGRFFLCCKLQCVCLFSATFQTTLCRYILFCELVHAWDNRSKDTVCPNNISRRWLWQQEKRTHDKRRREVERRETLWASLRASHNEPRTRTHILCEPAQSKCTSTCHKHFIQKFAGKMPQTKMSPERRQTFCASLRGRNTCQDFTKTALYRNLQEKCCSPEWAPWGLYTYRKNPSVWTQCFGKKNQR